MKKLAIVVALAVVLLAIPASVFAQKVDWDGQVHKGDFAAFVGAGFGWGFTIAPGVEWAFAEWKVGDVVPLAFGLSAKGMINFYPGFWTSYGVGALVTVHLGFKGLDIPDFLQKFDVYASAGIGFSFFSYDVGIDTYGSSNIGFATADGVAYYFNDKFAVYAEGTYWGYSGGGTIGVRYTF